MGRRSASRIPFPGWATSPHFYFGSKKNLDKEPFPAVADVNSDIEMGGPPEQEKVARAKGLPLGDRHIVRQIYPARAAGGRKCGADYAVAILKEKCGRDCARTRMEMLLKKYASGPTPEQVFARYGKGKGRKCSKATDVLSEKILADIRAKRDNADNSLRCLAKRHKVAKTTVREVLKKSKSNVQKKTTAPGTSAGTRKSRAEFRRKFWDMRAAGELSPGTLFSPDESWFEIDPKNFNAQNRRVYIREDDSAGA